MSRRGSQAASLLVPATDDPKSKTVLTIVISFVVSLIYSYSLQS